MQDEVYAFDWTLLKAHYGAANTTGSQFFPINVTLQAECHHGGGVRITLPDGFQTTIDGRTGNDAELFEHLRRLLIIAGQWPHC